MMRKSGWLSLVGAAHVGDSLPSWVSGLGREVAHGEGAVGFDGVKSNSRVVNNPLIRPYFLRGGWHWGGTLRFQ